MTEWLELICDWIKLGMFLTFLGGLCYITWMMFAHTLDMFACEPIVTPKYHACIMNNELNCIQKQDIWYADCVKEKNHEK